MIALLPGTPVSARGLLWEVVFSQASGVETLYRLRCQEGFLRGQERDFLSPFEAITPVAKELRPDKAAPLADWLVYHRAFLIDQALGTGALQAAQPGRLKIQPYQLVPVMRAIQMGRPRLLLADGVGLGKTVEAGLILAELIARRRAHRILIVTPPGPLLDQWRAEMRERFGLRFRVLDRDSLQEIRYASELDSNPFDSEALGLISIDFAKQEVVLRDIERTQWDVVVIDEAHHCVRLGEGGDRDDSLRRRLAEVLACKADALLLLTATPHDGDDLHFASLVELLDRSLVDGRGDLRGDAYRRVVVRRLKSHIRDPKTGEPLFKERRVFPRAVPFSSEGEPRFAAFQRALLELVTPQLKRALRQKKYGDVLSFVMLLKRSVSTAAACRNTIGAVIRRLRQLRDTGLESQEARRQRLKTLRALDRRIALFGTLSTEEERERAELEANDLASELAEQAVADTAEEAAGLAQETRRERDRITRLNEVVSGLERLEELAGEATHQDPKLKQLINELREIRAAEPGANVLVFTEYIDSQEAAVDLLRAAVKKGSLEGEVHALSGLSADEGSAEVNSTAAARKRILQRFGTENGIILVTTDTTAEGLNLHARCHHLVHLELPYNPNRLEQRNGRIDRFGQKFEPEVRYLYLQGTFEERLLLRLVAKYERQRARLTFVPNTLGILASDSSSETVSLLEGIAGEQARLFESAGKFDFASGEDEDTSSPAYRDLLGEIDRALSGFERAAKAHSWLADTGLGAEPSALIDAGDAMSEGSRLAGGDLLTFVLDAVRADSADPNSVREVSSGVFELRLSPVWTHGLDELPGYDSGTRTLRLTTDLDQNEDAEGRSVGFLGRAHPIVRRALDRVRHSQFGGGDVLDRRVSAARLDAADGASPAVLFTFVARVSSGNETELERVVATLVRPDGSLNPMVEPEEWRRYTALDHAVPPAGVWGRHFESWAGRAEAAARLALESAFEPIFEDFKIRHSAALAREQDSLDAWLRGRTEETTGAPSSAIQPGLFAEAASTLPSVPATGAWVRLVDPVQRLAAFAVAMGLSVKARREAESVLRIYEERKADLDRRGRLSTPTVELLGMLLLVPDPKGAS